MKRVLASMSASERAAKSVGILERIFVRPEYQAARTIMAYYSFGTEVETAELLRRCIENKQRLVLPRIQSADNSMHAHIIADLGRDLACHALGFCEPRPDIPQAALESIDLVLVPGLAFSPDGLRLGRGQGYYDRFLARTPAFRIGLAFDAQIIPVLPADAHDQRVHAVLTESQSYA
jgi:5-formyltetrahydrofolate cyclo-ligase